MSYQIKRKLDDAALLAVTKLEGLFSGNIWAQRYISDHKFRCADDVDNVLSMGSGSKVLNIGGAPYIFEVISDTKGLAVTSLDLDPNRHTEVVDAFNFSVLSVDIEDSRSRNDLNVAEYDVIVLAEVFEHLRIDLIGTLNFLYASMSTGSRIYLTTPNFFFFRKLLKNIFNGRSGPSVVKEWRKLAELGHMGHVREYSKIELIEVFEFVGFEIVDTRFRNRNSKIHMSMKRLLPTTFFTLLERSFDLFAQELVFVLRKS